MPEETLYLIDATAFCYRAFYALQGLATSFGQPTNSVYGFTVMLGKLLKEKKPQYIAACFDVSRDTFRQKKFAEYKLHRPPMPEGLAGQLPFIKQIVRALGVAIFEREGFEADDLIATIARKAAQRHMRTVIVSQDKDILQLVGEHTLVLCPYKDEGTLYDEKKVLERYGVKPGQIADVISLMGDEADNVPGIPGIGEKTASSLIREFGSLESLIANLEQVRQEKARSAIRSHLERLALNKELVRLDGAVELEFSLEQLKRLEPDYEELFRIFRYLEFKSLLKELPRQSPQPMPAEAKKLEGDALSKCLSGSSGLYLYGENPQDMVFFSGGSLFRAADCAAALSDPALPKIGHDLKKTKVMLARKGVALEGLHFDTMVAAYLLNPSRPGYSLAEVAWDYLGIALEGTPEGEAALPLIVQLLPKLEGELADKELLKLFRDLEMPLVEVLAEMELTGITVDTAMLETLSRDIEKRLIKLVEEIYEQSGCQFNINSTKQLREVLFEKLGLPVIKKGKTGPSTDEEVLRVLAGRHRLPALLVEYRQLTKLKNTYVDTLPGLVDKKTGRIHTSFNQTATETGRLSSSNPNLQNIPVKTEIGRKIRMAIVSCGKGRRLLSCDYSQIELRILAHLANDDGLVAAFRQGQDVHRLTASLIFGLSEKEVGEEQREVAKRVNFGIIYGLTSYGLSRDLGIRPQEAEQFIDAYFARYPRVKEYIQEQIRRAEEDGYVTTLLGRRRYLPDIKSKNSGIRQFAERQAVNTPIQGSASDLIKLAMVDISGRLRGRRMDAHMLLQIHDELLFDVAEEDLTDTVELVRDRMENVMQLSVPIKVDIKQGNNWLEMEDITK